MILAAASHFVAIAGWMIPNAAQHTRAAGWRDMILTTRPPSNPGRHRGYAGAEARHKGFGEEPRHGSS